MSIVESATKYAALTALGAAIDTAKMNAAADLSEAVHGAGLSKGEVPTPLGPITLVERKATTEIVIADTDALIAWCEINLPSALIRPKPVVTLNEQSRKQLLTERFVIIAGDVVDSQSGEVLDFVRIKRAEAGMPGVSYRASETQREVKRAAADVTEARTQQLVAAVLEAHEALKAIES